MRSFKKSRLRAALVRFLGSLSAPEQVAKGPIDDDYKALHRAVARGEREMSEAFMVAIERLKRRTSESAIEDALRHRRPQDAFGKVPWDQLEISLKESMLKQIQSLMSAGAKASEGTLLAKAEIGLRFDIMNPEAQRWAKNHSAKLVTQVTDETKQGIRDVIDRAVTTGIAPKVAAREIKGMIGLTTRQVRAVERYRDTLFAGQMRPDKAAREVERYQNKLLKQRSELIARTETMTAANQGRRELWNQAASKGLVNATRARIRWILTPDDRLCDRCQAMKDVTIGFNEDFRESPDKAGISMPPLHPGCRCTASIFFSKPEDSGNSEITTQPQSPEIAGADWANEIRIAATNINGEQDIIRIGELMWAQVKKSEDQTAWSEYRKWLNRKEYLDQQLGVINNQAAFMAAKNEISDLRKAIHGRKQELITARQAAIKDTLSQIRPMGGSLRTQWTSRTSAEFKNKMESIAQYLPSEWIQKSLSGGGIRGVIQNNGISAGHYDAYGRTVELMIAPNSTATTWLHEMMHRMEDMSPVIGKMERDFLERRTSGEALVSLPGYRSTTKGKVDKFIDPYVGRYYNESGNVYWEVLSRGAEWMWFDIDNFDIDPDMGNFIMGVFTAL